MNYIYVGQDSEFASYGDVFTPSKGGKGYVHNFTTEGQPSLYIGVPAEMVEHSEQFVKQGEEPICNVCVVMEKMRQDFINKLVGARLSFCRRTSHKIIDDLISYAENYQPGIDE